LMQVSFLSQSTLVWDSSRILANLKKGIF